jgi:hypothetical protein
MKTAGALACVRTISPTCLSLDGGATQMPNRNLLFGQRDVRRGAQRKTDACITSPEVRSSQGRVSGVPACSGNAMLTWAPSGSDTHAAQLSVHDDPAQKIRELGDEPLDRFS